MVKEEAIYQKSLSPFFYSQNTTIMTESWPKCTQEEALSSGFDYTTRADAEDLAFLNYDTIPQEQITDMNDAGSLISLDVSTPSDSSEEESQAWRSIVKELDLEIKLSENRMYEMQSTSKAERLKLRVG